MTYHSPTLISILMPVHNGARYLREAIASVLAQRGVAFELLIIDDGSTDESAAIAASYGARLRLERLTPNQGIVAALNYGAQQARGTYLARLDSDDRCRPGRLAHQARFLDRNPAIGICGTWAQTFGEGLRGEQWRYPTDDAAIRARLLFQAPFAHPAVMLRRSLLEATGGYPEGYPHAEDFALWARCAPLTRMANLSEVLLEYRIHTQQIGQRNQERQQASSDRVREGQLAALGLTPTPAELATHRAVSTYQAPADHDALGRAGAWLERLRASNRLAGLYPEPAFSRELARRWYHLCRSAAWIGPWVWGVYMHSSLSRAHPRALAGAGLLMAKCWIRRG